MALPDLDLQKKLARVGWSVLYSSYKYTSGAGTLAGAQTRYYTTALGQAGQGYTAPLTISETNLRTGGQIPGQQAFICYGASFALFNAAAQAPVASANMHTIIDGTIAQWDFQQTRVEIAKLSQIGAAGGFFGVAGTVGAVAAELTNGAGGYWQFREPVVLSPLATVNVLLTNPSTSVAVTADTVGVFTLIGRYQNSLDVG
jgi:hypothetical protein